MCGTIRHVLENHHLRYMQVKQRIDLVEATRILARSTSIVNSPVNRRKPTFKKDESKTARLRIDCQHEIIPSARYHTLVSRIRRSARSIALSSNLIFIFVFLDGSPWTFS